MIDVVILKPTKKCQAQCDYCSAPYEEDKGWALADFEILFKRLEPILSKNVTFIWHGGEPMLMGPSFYAGVKAITDESRCNIDHSIQTNLLMYDTEKWQPIFDSVFNGSVSTSFEFEKKHRTIKGSADKYADIFLKKLDVVMGDGFRPLVISTLTSNNLDDADMLYEHALRSHKKDAGVFDIRINYRYPAGNGASIDKHEILTPVDYTKVLMRLYQRKKKDSAPFQIFPNDLMVMLCEGQEKQICPWTSACGGKFLEIEPNGDMYNCADYADLGKQEFKYGNIFNETLNLSRHQSGITLHTRVTGGDFSKKFWGNTALLQHQQRPAVMPKSCYTCDHFAECGGGCMRDAQLYGRGMGGKFYYCDTWKSMFSVIKKDLATSREE